MPRAVWKQFRTADLQFFRFEQFPDSEPIGGSIRPGGNDRVGALANPVAMAAVLIDVQFGRYFVLFQLNVEFGSANCAGGVVMRVYDERWGRLIRYLNLFEEFAGFGVEHLPRIDQQREVGLAG